MSADTITVSDDLFPCQVALHLPNNQLTVSFSNLTWQTLVHTIQEHLPLFEENSYSVACARFFEGEFDQRPLANQNDVTIHRQPTMTIFVKSPAKREQPDAAENREIPASPAKKPRSQGDSKVKKTRAQLRPAEQKELHAAFAAADNEEEKVRIVRELEASCRDYNRSVRFNLPMRFSSEELQVFLKDKAIQAVDAVRGKLEALAENRVFLTTFKLNDQPNPFLECFPNRPGVPRPLLSKLPEEGDAGLTDDFLWKKIHRENISEPPNEGTSSSSSSSSSSIEPPIQIATVSQPSLRVSILLDVSGSGKTRSMFELLCNHVGLFFVGENTDNGGSADLKSLVLRYDPEITNDREDAAYQFLYLLEYRWQIYQEINRIFRGTLTPKEWLLLQAYPSELTEKDFSNLFIPDHIDRVQGFQPSIPPDTPIILDEAQNLKEFQFIRTDNEEISRTFLSPIVMAIANFSQLRLIIGGTGLSLEKILSLASLLRSKFDKKDAIMIRCLGGFHTMEQIQKCLEVFGLSGLASDEKVVRYLFNRLRGRTRFLTEVLTDLCTQKSVDFETLKILCREHQKIMTTFSKQKTLNMGVNQFLVKTSVTDSVGRLYIASQSQFTTLSSLVFNFRYTSLPFIPFNVENNALLEYGLCRFINDDRFEGVCINEPLVVLAFMANQKMADMDPLLTWIRTSCTSSERGNKYEYFSLLPLLTWLSQQKSWKNVFAFEKTSEELWLMSEVFTLPFAVDNFDPDDVTGCLAETNWTTETDQDCETYDIFEYFCDVARAVAFYAHTLAKADCVLLLRFLDLVTGLCKFKVPLFIQFKSGKLKNSLAEELSKLDPAVAYLKKKKNNNKAKKAKKSILLERNTQLNDKIQEMFGGRWLGLLLVTRSIYDSTKGDKFKCFPNGFACVLPFDTFLDQRDITKIDQVVLTQARESKIFASKLNSQPTKKQYTCSICHRKGHNARSCKPGDQQVTCPAFGFSKTQQDTAVAGSSSSSSSSQ